MPPAARVTDMHTCPMVTGIVPHVGGPILPPGAPTVLIDFLPAARVTDLLTCVGPPDTIVKGSAGVFINFLPAARMGDLTAHGGVIILGAPNVLIGEIGSPSPGAGGIGSLVAGLLLSGVAADAAQASTYAKGGAAPAAAAVLAAWRAKHKDAITQALKDQHALLEKRKADLATYDAATKAEVKKWFGSDSEATRKTLQDRIDKEIALNEKMTVNNFHPADPPEPGTFAYVHPGDKDHNIFLDSAFDDAPATGNDSKAGTLAHEMSHFSDIGGTEDNAYGQGPSLALAKKDSAAALNNADSFEYFVEGAK